MDLSNKRELIWLSELLRDVHDASPQSTPLVVGAMARDLVLHYGHGVPIARATADLDLGFEISACSANPAILLDACEAILAQQTDPDGSLQLVAESETEITGAVSGAVPLISGMPAASESF